MTFRWLAAVLLLAGGMARAQHIKGYNYDESAVPPYTMLDPLQMNDGQPVRTPEQWWTARRPQILKLFEENIYGRTPAAAKTVPLRAHVVEEGPALGGKAIRRQVDLYFTDAGASGLKLRLLLYLPRAAQGQRVPVIVGLNFGGNQSVLADPAIQPTPVWTRPKGETALRHELPADATRGSQTAEWQVEKVIASGYGFATAYYGDLEPDFKDAPAADSIRSLFGATDAPRAGDAWGAIGAWAWGLSRAMDYLQTVPEADASRIAVTGHSRLGKSADWAAAQDGRFAAILSTESGKAGQSLLRRGLGENVAHLEHSFPYWFAPNFAQWVGHDQQIPADGNLLLSLLAPRPLYVASAVGDEWSDPHGEFLSLESASRVYKLLGAQALGSEPMPAVDHPLRVGVTAYHVRTGKHDVTAFDWDGYLQFLHAVWPPVRPASAAQVSAWRSELRKALFVPDPLPALRTRRYGSFAVTPEVVAERVTYGSEFGLRVPAIVYRPAHPPHGRLPALVLVNGHGADKTSWYSYYTAVVYAQAGAVVVTYDPIGEGERNDEHRDGTGEHDQVIELPTMPARLGGVMVTDILQAVSYLRSRPDVDPARVGVLGFSMGSFEAALAGAADPRIHALLLTGGGDLDGPGGYWDSSHAVMCQSGPWNALAVAGLGDRPAVVYTLNARRGDTLVLNGTADTVVDIPHHAQQFFAQLQTRTEALNGSPQGVFTTEFDPGASHRPNWMTPLAATWLNGELHFPNWQGRDVAQLPSEPMRTWAESVGYPLGKSSGREDRDAGLPMLTAGVPLLTPEQLSVLPRAEWERQKADFVYTSWVQDAEAAAKQ